jgi:small-conductance mechanosensitive channel
MLAAFEAHSEILDSPGPNVFLDGIESGSVVFNATGTVSSPRKSYGVRSDLLFDILGRLKQSDVPMARSATMLLREVAAGDVPAPETAAAAPREPGPPPAA